MSRTNSKCPKGISSSQPIGGNQFAWLIDSTHPIIFENPPLPQRDPRIRRNNQLDNISSNESTQSNAQPTNNNTTDNQHNIQQDYVVPGPSNTNVSDTVDNTNTHMDTTINSNPPAVTPPSYYSNTINTPTTFHTTTTVVTSIPSASSYDNFLTNNISTYKNNLITSLLSALQGQAAHFSLSNRYNAIEMKHHVQAVLS